MERSVILDGGQMTPQARNVTCANESREARANRPLTAGVEVKVGIGYRGAQRAREARREIGRGVVTTTEMFRRIIVDRRCTVRGRHYLASG